MRTLGPGSVSSFLKIVVEVVHAALWAALGLIVVGAVLVLVCQPFIGSVYHVDLHDLSRSHMARVSVKPTALAFGMFGLALYVAGMAAVFNRLRRVFEALTQGDPFRPQNVGRLQVVGAVLIALQLWSYLLPMLERWAVPGLERHGGGFDPTAWFAILVVFVLAEVFREGARLRQDAELTI
jgi:hypothetical protein